MDKETKEQREREAEERLERKKIRQVERDDREQVRQEEREERKRDREKALGQEESSPKVTRGGVQRRTEGGGPPSSPLLYSPKCVEVEFCELRHNGVLRSSEEQLSRDRP